MFQKLFQYIEKEEIPNYLYEVSITLITKSSKEIHRKNTGHYISWTSMKNSKQLTIRACHYMKK